MTPKADVSAERKAQIYQAALTCFNRKGYFQTTMDDIVAEIAQGLSFLESDLHDLPDRHRSMEAVFDVSWRRLSESEQDIFARLCVFRGGFTLAAAQKVAGATPLELIRLRYKSLLYGSGDGRYSIHELLPGNTQSKPISATSASAGIVRATE